MCADCHSTDVNKNFDLATNTFSTSYNEIDVSCEACHGPAKAHLALAKSGKLNQDGKGTGFVSLKRKLAANFSVPNKDPRIDKERREDARTEIEACMSCHARRHVIQRGYVPGKKLNDYYVPELLDTETYYGDGQIRDEVYVYGSFVQSKMHHKGVRCSDCHNPHSGQLRAQGNNLCIQCHDTNKFNVEAHYRHKPDSTGAQCVN